MKSEYNTNLQFPGVKEPKHYRCYKCQVNFALNIEFLRHQEEFHSASIHYIPVTLKRGCTQLIKTKSRMPWRISDGNIHPVQTLYLSCR